MLERIIILSILFILTALFIHGYSSVGKKIHIQLPGKFNRSNSLPTIVYFWTDKCVQCYSLQKPALERLQNKNGNFNLVSINAVDERGLVSLFRIKTVPSTVIFGFDGKSRYINNGFRDENKLEKQIEELLI
jgi:thioredoxin-like negative regulator of GroEL